MGLHLAALILPIFISPIFVFSSEIKQISSKQHLVNDLDAAKLRLSQLEAILEASIQKVDAKTLYLEKSEKLIQDAESQIHDLQSASYSFEVKLLWDALRSTNFKLHVLEDKARDAEDRVKATALEVEQMTEVITEQWIQVQHLEQMREFNNRRHNTPSRCSFLKLMRDIQGKHLPKVHEAFDIHWEGNKVSLFVRSYLTQALSLLKSMWVAFTKYHHQLQGFIKHNMERNEITAALANREVVFFVASAFITFPVFGAWILLSS